jgi:hypothetical protein
MATASYTLIAISDLRRALCGLCLKELLFRLDLHSKPTRTGATDMSISENPKGDAILYAISNRDKSQALSLLKENVAETVAIALDVQVGRPNLEVAINIDNLEVTHAADRTPPASA